MNDHQKGLFRKYLFTKSQNNIGTTNEEESEAIRKAPTIPFTPPKFGHTSRPPSLLEQRLLPVMKRNVMPPTSSGEKSPIAQLTIFYAGAINVYDDVSIDKAQAIMLLAEGSSISAPIVTNTPKMDEAKPHQQSNLPSLCKLQADLPLARKYSLQRFLEKRRRRTTPYAAPSTSTTQHVEDDKEQSTNGLNGKTSFSHSPFPSRLGYFYTISANKG